MDAVIGKFYASTFRPLQNPSAQEQRHVGVDPLEVSVDPTRDFSDRQKAGSGHNVHDLQAMITFAALIVVTHAADAVHHIGEPVLGAVRTTRDGLGNFAYNQLGEAGADDKSFA